MMEKDSKIYVAEYRGMVGSAIIRELERQGYPNILPYTHRELDLTWRGRETGIRVSRCCQSGRNRSQLVCPC